MARMRIGAVALFGLWVLLGAALAAVNSVAWGYPATMKGWIDSWQSLYPAANWFFNADTHTHALMAMLAGTWFGIGCRLFAPRTIPWLPLTLCVLLAMGDEICQLGSPDRNFEWSDLMGDLTGMILALPIMLLLRFRVRVESATPRGRKQARS